MRRILIDHARDRDSAETRRQILSGVALEDAGLMVEAEPDDCLP